MSSKELETFSAIEVHDLVYEEKIGDDEQFLKVEDHQKEIQKHEDEIGELNIELAQEGYAIDYLAKEIKSLEARLHCVRSLWDTHPRHSWEFMSKYPKVVKNEIKMWLEELFFIFREKKEK